MFSQVRSTSTSFQQQLECTTTLLLLNRYNPKDGQVLNDPPTKKLRTLSFAKKLVGQPIKVIPTTK